MANQPPPPSFRWRTILEVAAISVVIYIVLGFPGLPPTLLSTTSDKTSTPHQDVPVGHVLPDTLVSPDKNLSCPPHDPGVHIFSTEPLVLYLEHFLTEAESDHLLAISEPNWQPSTIFHAGVETTDPSVRNSEKALLERDATVQCLELRALAVQGWPRDTYVERLWTQRYGVGGHYSHHYDWGAGGKGGRRRSSFMVYVSSECEGGGTNFPRLEMPKDERWCEFVECDGGGTEGVTFKARKGSAVFWMNFDGEGRGYKETVHAGMPVTKGTKVGLNIWSWYQGGSVVV